MIGLTLREIIVFLVFFVTLTVTWGGLAAYNLVVM